jgi:NH3-dependent NAD+ synthetase
MDTIIQQYLEWIQTNTPNNLGVLVPLSGGTDSALCFWLYTEALRGRVVGVHIGESLRGHTWLAQRGEVQQYTLPQTDIGIEEARWSLLLSKALKENRILVSSRNKTEQALGTYSQASRVAYHVPLVGTWKNDIIELCKHVGVPQDVIDSSLAADPVCGREEAYAHISPVDVDHYLKYLLKIERTLPPISQAQIDYLQNLYEKNNFKHKLPRTGPDL